MDYQSPIKNDYSTKSGYQSATTSRVMPRPWLGILTGCVLLVLLLTFAMEKARAVRSETPMLQQTLSLPKLLDIDQASAPSARDGIVGAKEWREIEIRRGDTLSTIFSEHDLDVKEMQSILTLRGEVRALKRLLPGKTLKIRADDQGQLQTLHYDLNEGRILEVERNPKGFNAAVIANPLEQRLAYASGLIDSSLFLSAQKAKLSDRLTMQLATIFGWDIDFALDIRNGDAFSVAYEEFYRDGEKVRDGAIVAAQFTNQGKTYTAIRYVDADGAADYYTPQGMSMRKAFIRTPVEFSRISSGFNLKRRHPVLNLIRAHKGVDYAAPNGTPVMAAGNGKIVYKAGKGGYGNTVMIQHDSKNRTLYAHLARYARNVNLGSKVKQGQVIGYVGQTGLATGPHLHYEFQVNGIQRNPLTAPPFSGEPIPNAKRKHFLDQASTLTARLELFKNTAIALASE